MERWGSIRMSLVLCVVISMFAAAPGAAAEQGPHFTDRRGDANFWGHAFYLLAPQPDPVPDPYEGSPDTRPVSIDGADLVEAWYQTEYQTIKERDAAGGIVRVRHLPTHLRVSVRTNGPASPTFGPTVVFWVYAKTAACPGFEFTMTFLGPHSPPADRQQAGIRSCDAATPSALQVTGDVSSFTVPLSGALAAGAQIESRTPTNGAFGATGNVVSFASVNGGLRLVDITKPGTSFVIGSDVPVDIDCIALPSHPACSDG